MIIHEIRTGDLPAFIESSLFRSLSPKPITRMRALSQFQNPRASPDDVALIIACEENTLLAMAGLLPDYIGGDPGLHASSNSGWWAHPVKGRHLALPVFARAMKCCKHRMFLTDCTPRSRDVLGRTGWFEFLEPVPGMKTVFRFYFHRMIRQRIDNKILSLMGKVADIILNGTIRPAFFCRQQHDKLSNFVITERENLDVPLSRFITDHSRQEFIRRTSKELEWIVKWKWLQTERPENNGDYPFSDYTGSFRQFYLIFSSQAKTIALVLLNIRENHATVPCFYCEDGAEEPVWSALHGYLIRKQIVTFTSFMPEYIRTMEKYRLPALYKKRVVRHIAVTKELLPLLRCHPRLQDGDGDIIFT